MPDNEVPIIFRNIERNKMQRGDGCATRAGIPEWDESHLYLKKHGLCLGEEDQFLPHCKCILGYELRCSRKAKREICLEREE